LEDRCGTSLRKQPMLFTFYHKPQRTRFAASIARRSHRISYLYCPSLVINPRPWKDVRAEQPTH